MNNIEKSPLFTEISSEEAADINGGQYNQLVGLKIEPITGPAPSPMFPKNLLNFLEVWKQNFPELTNSFINII